MNRRQLLLAAVGAAALAVLPATAHAGCGNFQCRSCYPRSYKLERKTDGSVRSVQWIFPEFIPIEFHF